VKVPVIARALDGDLDLSMALDKHIVDAVAAIELRIRISGRNDTFPE
jgi:hypothetical protein